MSRKLAKEYFLGADGNSRMSCAQAVAMAFKEKFSLRDEELAALGASAGGRAPGGLCGALYAIDVLFRGSGRNEFETAREAFVSHAGSDRCRAIRVARKIKCVDCVEIAATLLEKSLS